MKRKEPIFSHKGFTLVELLVVISIIAILALMATVNYDGARANARDAKRVSDITQLRARIEVAAGTTIIGLYPRDWPAGVVAQLSPLMNAAYCYYTDVDSTSYLLMVVGIEGEELASLGSPIGVVPMAQAASENATKVVGNASCPTVAELDTVAEITLTCAEPGRYCRIGGF